MTRCVFPGCENTAHGVRTLTFASVYAKTRLANLDKWKAACGVEEFAKNASICSDHFRDEDFVNPKFKSQGLKPNAIPTRDPKAARVEEAKDVVEPVDTMDVDGTSESSGDTEHVVEPPEPRQFRYVGEVDEDALDCSPMVRRAFKVLKKTIRQDKARMGMYQKRNSRLREENELLKKVLDGSEKEGCSAGEVLERIVGDGLKKKDAELVRKFEPRTVKVERRITMELLGKITCRLCLGTSREEGGRSAFSSFAGEDFLSDIVETCFGIRVEEHDFCTSICEECLVKVDVAWKLYAKFQSNRLALEEFYRSLKEKKNVEDVDQDVTEQFEEEEEPAEEIQDVTEQIEEEVREEQGQLQPSDPESSDSECYSLPDHPFFTAHTKSVYLCHLCDKQFERSNSLDYHLYTNHQENDQDQLCQICAKFIHKRQIRRHVEFHNDTKPVCSICNQAFHNRQNLERHMVVHTKERPYGCTLCDLRFTQSGCLKQHVQRVHMPPSTSPKSPPKPGKHFRKPALCPVCGLEFKISRKLIAHVEETHPEHQLEVFTCELCYKQFITLQLLQAHRAIWHPKQEYHCEQCGKTFPTIGMLGKHLKKHEKEKLQGA
ncbi:PR domain zinc finger protein 5 [Culex quinquefasciatus]|uniref:PR domain zinc finger protein 5 n=1 Tax=Culex quinquefasciatus TaxID=7176 RepID=UPI0018E2BC3E|nr:PR domain zinc finger protein 5 [Culex quinquefasciatus]